MAEIWSGHTLLHQSVRQPVSPSDRQSAPKVWKAGPKHVRRAAWRHLPGALAGPGPVQCAKHEHRCTTCAWIRRCTTVTVSVRCTTCAWIRGLVSQSVRQSVRPPVGSKTVEGPGRNMFGRPCGAIYRARWQALAQCNVRNRNIDALLVHGAVDALLLQSVFDALLCMDPWIGQSVSPSARQSVRPQSAPKLWKGGAETCSAGRLAPSRVSVCPLTVCRFVEMAAAATADCRCAI